MLDCENASATTSQATLILPTKPHIFSLTLAHSRSFHTCACPHADYYHQVHFERSRKTCDQKYWLGSTSPFFRNDQDKMHLHCIEKCLANPKCKYCFVQNKKDGIKGGKCQLFTGCDTTRLSSKTGRTFAIVPKYTSTATTTTTTSQATTTVPTSSVSTAAGKALAVVTTPMRQLHI